MKIFYYKEKFLKYTNVQTTSTCNYRKEYSMTLMLKDKILKY